MSIINALAVAPMLTELTTIDLVSAVYQSMDRTKDHVLSNNIINAFKSLNEAQYTKFINGIIDDGYVMPMYVPQFKEPTKEMIRNTVFHYAIGPP